MKKKIMIYGLFALSLFAAPMTSFALRVLEYTWECKGSGGNCLDTVVITPKIQ